MCRIAAIISEDKPNLPARIAQMTQAMQHGGPDDTGHYVDDELPVALGHKRLSIIDLSSGGHQPYFSNDGQLVLSFNGEIYNYLELKKELREAGYSFRSDSDTEVLIYAYAEWGTDCLSKLEGMFAFVLIDKRKRKVIAARDHAGIKPLYYGKKGGDLYFSSEIRGISAIDQGWPQNTQWPVWFLSFGFIPEPHTTLQNVWHLPKQHYLLYDLDTRQYEIRCYEKFIFTSDIQSYDEAVSAVRETVTQAVKKHLIADVPTGVFLSGGIDSSILTIAAQQMVPEQLKTLSIYFEDEAYSEKYYQDLVIRKTNVAHRSYKVGRGEFVESLPDIYKAMDQPSTDGINSYFITRYAREEGLKVVLSGLGADELFGGYPSFKRTGNTSMAARLHLLSHVLPFGQLKYPQRKGAYYRKNRWYNDYLVNRGLFIPRDVAAMLNISQKEVNEVLASLPPLQDSGKVEQRNRTSQLESELYMQSQLLRDSDVYSMWHSLELRVPFLDKKIMQLVHRMDPVVKFNGSIPKQLLIDAFKNELPEEIWKRPKQGFTFPLETWFRTIPAFENPRYIPVRWQKEFSKKRINYSRVWGIFLLKTLGDRFPAGETDCSKSPDRLFMYLAAFSRTGGIEKVNRALLKAFEDAQPGQTDAYSVYDNFADQRYFPRSMFNGYNGNKARFMWNMLTKPVPWKHIVVGHINLALAARILKWRKKDISFTIMAHGIEAWPKVGGFKKWLLQNAAIIAVSEYTRKQISANNNIDLSAITVRHNCLDPFFSIPPIGKRPDYLLKRYGISPGEKIILTVTRLSDQEKYKGYDKTIEALSNIGIKENIRYLLCGNADTAEKSRIEELILSCNLSDRVIMPGFIADDELEDHYRLADAFVMPSKGEGFGIVFIEAAACGTPVIAGNSDGSAEAVLQGNGGYLVNADDVRQLQETIEKVLGSVLDREELGRQVQKAFSFNKYKNNILSHFSETNPPIHGD
ncbi:asparagine synthase (glutamine-hydrolyzing) [Sediminibacterium ginsengisoli]|uniref:asparagine synthase (glutamine-hydrolyzing) n=1 Tax=Sediminibacterium ginsengisoli TaxID=413434 RepID=A0A1T4Q6T5_9BACT|nr:asparagine synthase (glutamine-hydrolyzing) [Sediminibacterium ginsengisoli]SJZ99241.1 asparagine synthase (glutamine-hydrolyzing) [Sediminibacterium ginsengisoli]